ncbi:MAG: type I polyketide synthase, partial [Myxococcota bacterium]|nr:type I polyketide synthase [Myxococcota bacterium]
MNSKPQESRVAIIGMACVFPQAPDLDSFWQNIIEARDCLSEIPEDRWKNELIYSPNARDLDKSYVLRGGFIKDAYAFGAMHFGIAPRRLQVMDPQHRLLLETVRAALMDAGLDDFDFQHPGRAAEALAQRFDPEHTGTFLGVSSAEFRDILATRSQAIEVAAGHYGDKPSPHAQRAILDGVSRIAPINSFSMPGSLLNMTAANVAYQWRLRGPAFTIDAACASSLIAIFDALTYIRAGLCQTAIAGGVYLNLSSINHISFSRIGACSKAGRCRPFDAAADGFVQGEGAGIVVLKRLDAALRDGDRIHAVLVGGGANNDAGDSSGPMAPSLSGQIDCIQRALSDAKLRPSEVSFVECHGTGTPVGDPVEVSALAQVLATDPPPKPVVISSVKANIGHTMSAAGVAGLIKAALVVEKKVIPPQASFDTPHEKIPVGHVEIARRAEAWSSEAPRRAGISSFGFGGTNCHLIIEEPPQRERAPELSLQSGQPAQYLVMLSAPNRALLQGYVETLLLRLPAVDAPLRDIAFTLSATRSLDSLRAAIIVDSKARLLEELEKLRQALAADGAMPKQLGKTILIAQVDPVAKAPQLALMFPGQGSQRVGLLRSCYERFPAFKARFDALAEVADDLLERPLHSFLYPEAGSPEELEAAELALQETRICQPALGVLGLSLLELFQQMGLEASLSMGHSLGEFVGTAASKALSAEDAIRLVGWRGKLMSGLELEDNGQMAAVMSDVATVRKQLEGLDGVAVANVNQASQTVLSGTTAAMEQALSKLAEASISAKRLRVSHAFHSPIMQAIRTDMEKVLAQLSFAPPALPLVSAARGQLYPTEPDGCRELLAAHATEVVDFVNALQLAKQSGAELFLEMGAGSTLTTFAKSAGLPAIQLASAKDDGDLELMRAIAQLLLAGVPLSLRPLFEGADVQVLTLPATPILREQYLPFVEKGVPVRPNGMDVNELPPEPQAQTQAAPAAAGSEQLLALFREQTEVLRAHAGIHAQQTAILAGTPLP